MRRERERERVRRFQVSVATVVALAAGLVLVGWVADLSWATRIAPGLASMKPNTAACLLLLAAALVAPPAWHRGIAVLPGAVAAVALAEYALDTSSGFDQLLLAVDEPGPHPGRMAVATGFCLLFLSVGLVLSPSRHPRLVQGLALVVVAIAGIGILGYVYSVRSLYSTGAYSSVALHTAVALTLLSFAVLVAVPGGFVSWVWFGDDTGALLLRRVLPVSAPGIPFLGLLQLWGQSLGWYDPQMGLALMVVSSVFAVVVVSVYTAGRLALVDDRRQRAMTSLRVLTSDLEHRVQWRVEELEAERGRLAVLEDRQRIAADLHDHVIQGLYAAGMRLSAEAVKGTDASVPGEPQVTMPLTAITKAVNGIDDSITRLRATIFALNQPIADPATLADRLLEIVQGAGSPELDAEFKADGPLDQVDRETAEHLVAVVREGVSNVIRHAHARRLVVEVTVTDTIQARIADDGVGMAAVPDRASGVENLKQRARVLGGTCVWESSPDGTVLAWSAPLVRRGAEPQGRSKPAGPEPEEAGLELLRRFADAPPGTDIVPGLASAIAEHFGADSHTLLVAAGPDKLQIRVAQGMPHGDELVGRTVEREGSIAAMAMARGEPIVVDDGTDMPSARRFLGEEPHGSGVLLPIISLEEEPPVLGALGLGRESGEPFGRNEIQEAMTMVSYLALALHLRG